MRLLFLVGVPGRGGFVVFVFVLVLGVVGLERGSLGFVLLVRCGKLRVDSVL